MELVNNCQALCSMRVFEIAQQRQVCLDGWKSVFRGSFGDSLAE